MATSAHLCHAMAELCPVQNCFWLEYIDGVSAQNITNGVTSQDMGATSGNSEIDLRNQITYPFLLSKPHIPRLTNNHGCGGPRTVEISHLR